MFDTFDEIKKNKFINNLEETCKRFGITGVYVKWNADSNKEKNGIYFVFGADKEKVLNKDINIEKIFKEQQRDPQNFHLDICAVKLTDCSPFAIHQDITECCRDIEFISKLYQERGVPIPNKVDCTTLFYIETLYKNSVDKDISPENLAIYKEAVKEYFDVLDKKSNGKQEIPKSSGFKSLFGEKSNKVSLEKVFESSNSVVKHRISARLLPEFEKEMKNYPEILYHANKVNKIIFDAPEKGFGPNKEDNDLSTVDIAYNSIYKKDIVTILAKITVPEAFRISIQEMRDMCKEGDSICHFGIQEQEYNYFAKKCKEANVNFIIDNERIYFTESSGLINIAFYKSDIKAIDKILTEIAIEAEKYHTYDKNAEILTNKLGLNTRNKAIREYFEKLN